MIGEVMVDVLARVPGRPTTGSDTPATIVERDGGSAANVAEWLASLGAPVDLVARVGDDPAGRAARDRLAAAGVVPRLQVDDTASTGRCIVIVTPDGERTMLPDPGANAFLDAGSLDTTAWRPCDHLHVSGYSLMRPSARAAALESISQAVANGMSVSVDASSAAPLATVGPSSFLRWIGGCEVLIANADEARALTGSASPQDAAEALCGQGFLAVVKCGADGALAASPSGGRWEQPARAAALVDTTGAGDAFAAGFVGAWSGAIGIGGDVAAALRHGIETAARAVAREGGRP